MVYPQKLSHVNAVRLLDAFEDEQDVHLVGAPHPLALCPARWPSVGQPRSPPLPVNMVCLPLSLPAAPGVCVCACGVCQVFESCTGGELFEPIANRQFRFSEFEAATILRKLLRAVAHMHGMDVIHRDLKPENILFAEPGIDSELKVGVCACVPCVCVSCVVSSVRGRPGD